jgi:hypothetical protein
VVVGGLAVMGEVGRWPILLGLGPGVGVGVGFGWNGGCRGCWC